MWLYWCKNRIFGWKRSLRFDGNGMKVRMKRLHSSTSCAMSSLLTACAWLTRATSSAQHLNTKKIPSSANAIEYGVEWMLCSSNLYMNSLWINWMKTSFQFQAHKRERFVHEIVSRESTCSSLCYPKKHNFSNFNGASKRS